MTIKNTIVELGDSLQELIEKGYQVSILFKDEYNKVGDAISPKVNENSTYSDHHKNSKIIIDSYILVLIENCDRKDFFSQDIIVFKIYKNRFGCGILLDDSRLNKLHKLFDYNDPLNFFTLHE